MCSKFKNGGKMWGKMGIGGRKWRRSEFEFEYGFEFGVRANCTVLKKPYS